MEYVTMRTTLKHVDLMVEIVATVEIQIGTKDVVRKMLMGWLPMGIAHVKREVANLMKSGAMIRNGIVATNVPLRKMGPYVGITARDFVENVHLASKILVALDMKSILFVEK